MAHKKNERQGESVKQRDQGTNEDSKKTWKLTDECEAVTPEPEVSIKRMRKETTDSTTTMEVGVARLNWP